MSVIRLMTDPFILLAAWVGATVPALASCVQFTPFGQPIHRKSRRLCARRVWREHANEWQDAYGNRGPGSTFVRARIIGDDIYQPSAPIPGVTPSPDRNQFLHEVIAEVEGAGRRTGVRFE